MQMMSVLKKLLHLSGVAAFMVLISFLRKLDTHEEPRRRPGDGVHRDKSVDTLFWSHSGNKISDSNRDGLSYAKANIHNDQFHTGNPNPSSSTYTRAMIVPRMKNENISWIANELPDLDTVIYVANDPSAPLHPPKNKGHEVMIYLTYIIDHYDNLPDISIFMHAHRWTHHNNHLLGHDAVQMIRRLNGDYVTREGYVNMRCEWYPGCPEWLHPNNAKESLAKQEEEVLSRSWKELFPTSPLPEALGQACCAQFALSRERILSISLSQFIFYRDWVIRTPLSNYVSGRIWEYTWQFLFTGKSTVCPAEHICYCDGFGVCFGGDKEYKDFERLRQRKEGHEREVREFRARRGSVRDGGEGYGKSNASSVKDYDAASLTRLQKQIEKLEEEISARKKDALERGNNSENRARECGRYWEGDLKS